jgi:nicotinate-nucleotide adenylyltransferase
MLKLILKDPRIKIEMYEQNKDTVSFSHETLDALAAQYPQHTFSWLVGSDRLGDFHTWVDSRGNDYQDMLAAYRFYVYPRADFPFTPLYDNMVPLKQLPEWTYSSTDVRQKVKAGESIDGLVDPKVAEYIAKHRLYLA